MNGWMDGQTDRQPISSYKPDRASVPADWSTGENPSPVATAQLGAVAPEHGRPDSAAGQGDSEFSPSLALCLQKQSSVKSYIRVNVATHPVHDQS